MQSRPGVFSVALLALLASSSVAGCSSTNSEVPAWPKQPNPSYPNTDAASADKPLSDSAQTKAHASSHSELAKMYGDASALDTLTGKASYYADSLAGNHTANGDVYDPAEFTAAHKKLPFGTIVRVVREDTNATTYVRINDRGPFGSADRIIDLSKAAAEELDMMRAGVISVRVEVVEQPSNK